MIIAQLSSARSIIFRYASHLFGDLAFRKEFFKQLADLICLRDQAFECWKSFERVCRMMKEEEENVAEETE